MAISKVQVINAALALIGAKKLFATTDEVKSARLASDLYEISQNEIFDMPIDWHFATVRAELSRYGTAPAFGYEYQYLLPSRFRRIVALVDEDGDLTEYEWRRECCVEITGNDEFEHAVMLTNESEVFIKYIRQITNVNMWPAYFTKLVYINLAILLCEPLKQDKQKKNQILVMFEDARNWAVMSNAMENADVSDDNVNLDKGNQDVINASSKEESEKTYIVERE